MRDTYNILLTPGHLLYVLPQLGKVSFSVGIINIRCLINEDTRYFQTWDTRALRPLSILFDVFEDQGKVSFGPGRVYIAHNSDIGMTGQLLDFPLIILIWEIIESRTIEWIDNHGKGDCWVCCDPAVN
jgi:hypothetical protein